MLVEEENVSKNNTTMYDLEEHLLIFSFIDTVQAGFGWTNGVALWIFDTFSSGFSAPDCSDRADLVFPLSP